MHQTMKRYTPARHAVAPVQPEFLAQLDLAPNVPFVAVSIERMHVKLRHPSGATLIERVWRVRALVRP